MMRTIQKRIDPRKGRLFDRGLLFFACLLVASGLCGGAFAGQGPALSPKSIGGSIEFGYDWNLLGSSTAEKKAFGTDSQDYYFVVDRFDDWQGSIELWGRWDIPSFYKRLRVKARYVRTEWAHESILARDLYRFDLRQKLPDGSRLDLSARHEPQVYLRHRVDKDAAPGDPRFRPEAVRGTKISLGYTRPVSTITATGSIWYEGEDRNRWFNERDEKTWGAELKVALPVAAGMTLSPAYGLDRSQSRNKPDLGSDRSYNEHLIGLRWTQELSFASSAFEIDLATRWKFRTYSTDNPEDQSRYNRHDRIYGWSMRVARLGKIVTPFMSLQGAGRIVDLPAGADASDEEGEYNDLLVRAGIDWEI